MFKITFFTITFIAACTLSITLAFDADFFGAGIAFLIAGAFMYETMNSIVKG